jgi:cyclophilin family peptidyl-prolyl cis-trans isomerase
MARPKIYLALCLLALVTELVAIGFLAPVTCIRCKQPLGTPSTVLPELCPSCIQEIRSRLLGLEHRDVYIRPYPVDPTDPFVELQTTRGTVIVELFARKAPLSSENFLHYARRHDYDQVIFHRIEEYLCISGRFRGGYGGEALTVVEQFPPIKSEASNGLKNLRGTLQLPRLDENPDTATSDYSINLVDSPYYDWKGPSPKDAGYCVFGQVVAGFEVLDGLRFLPLTQFPPGPGYEHMPRDPVTVLRAVEIDPYAVGGLFPPALAPVDSAGRTRPPRGTLPNPAAK